MGRNATRVLVVDDNESGRYLKVRLLRRAGWIVDEAETGEEALELVERNPIGIVVLDVALPGMDGFEVCRIIKQRYSDVLVVQTSATYRDSTDRVLALDTGADAYIVEPMEDAELIATVRSLLRLRTIEEECRINEERLRLATEAGGVGVYDTDVEKGTTQISPELAAILGLPTATEISIEEGLALVDPRDRQALADRVADSVEGPGDGVLVIDMRLMRADGSVRWVSLRGKTYFQEVAGEKKAARAIGAVFDITDRKQWETTQHLLLGELNHRIKNTLTTVQSIASHTLRTTPDPQAFAVSFNGRLQALAQAHTLLTQSSWDGAYLDEIINNQLGDAEPGQVSHSGPRVFLPPKIALHVALTLHELATNARKYGALSAADGRLEINWTVLRSGKDILDFHWLETGGPPVDAPLRCGFGTKLIQQGLIGLGGKVELEFASTGVSCRLLLPFGTEHDTKEGASG